VIAAAALKCMGGQLQGRLWPRSEDEAERARAQGYELERVLDLDDLITGDNCFFAATGVTDGELLRGVRYDSHGASTDSLVTRSKSGTVRQIKARHRLKKLAQYAAVAFE
jgi:fructose-1,6-bisphosphatase II